jgi:hypothetical protein
VILSWEPTDPDAPYASFAALLQCTRELADQFRYLGSFQHRASRLRRHPKLSLHLRKRLAGFIRNRSRITT